MRFLTGVAVLVSGTFLAPGIAHSAETSHHRSAYAGEENRDIKALSSQDIDDLLNGRGWGFAKAAELNGMPGPAHLLEMADEIALSPEQRRSVETLFEAMRSEAIALGQTYVALERKLDRAFASGAVTNETLAELLEAIADVRGRLRLVHLRTHLQTPALLTPAQIARYNHLRGYAKPAGAHRHAH